MCHGVSLVRTTGGCRVAGCWSAQAEAKSASMAGTLARGRRELKVADGGYLLAGPSGGGWGMSEVSVPRLSGEDLRSALSFELRKCTPLPQEYVTWGYRVLPVSEETDGKLKVRLVYARSENWRRWLEVATGLGSVDAVLPPPAALDSLLTGTDVVVPGREGFRYTSLEGGREMLPCDAEAKRSIQELLPLDMVEWGELEKLSPEEQAGFIPAMLLALYGMGADFTKDMYTLPSIPHELRPRRFFAFKFIAGLLGCIIAVSLFLGIVRGAQIRAARIRILQSDISAVEKEIAALRDKSGGNRKNALAQLEAEISRYTFKTPELPEVLGELTRLIAPPAWMAGAFEWNLDTASQVAPVSFVIREPAGDASNLAIGTALNRSPLLGDVSESRSSQNRTGFIERKFVLKARYDTQEEAVQLKKEQEEERKRQKESRKAAEQAKTAAASAAAPSAAPSIAGNGEGEAAGQQGEAPAANGNGNPQIPNSMMNGAAPANGVSE